MSTLDPTCVELKFPTVALVKDSIDCNERSSNLKASRVLGKRKIAPTTARPLNAILYPILTSDPNKIAIPAPEIKACPICGLAK
ncbi:hypothetical protein GCM10027454_09720 [Algoriphagus aestuariicola]